MNNKKRQPFTISRTNTFRSSVSFLDKSLSNSFEDLNPPLFRKQSSFLSKQNSLNFHDTAFKSHYNIFKTDSNLMPDLLEKYSQDNLQYRDEEFTQQAETFITKVAADKRIPKDLRAKFPLYQILISICKIFMLNEYEIVVFACSLDHCNWRMEEVVLPEESDFLKEFPSNFGVEISDECKRFIMYLLIITFSLKQYLNEKINVDKIQAYCEKICVNFQTLFNRWTKISSFHKFNYSAPEINRKFKYLSRKEYGDHVTSVKDYNMIVDNIMTLTGSYSSKPKIDCKPLGTHLPTPSNNYVSHKSDVLAELASFPAIEAKSLFHEPTPIPGLGESLSRKNTIDFLGESPGLKIPSVIPGFSRQNSISNFLSGLSSVKRQNSFELFEELSRKLLKQDTSSTTNNNNENNNSSSNNNSINGNSTTLHQPIPRKDTSAKLPDLSALTSLLKGGDSEDILSIALPMLSKKSSTVSQQGPEELPSLSRFNSTFSFLYENK